MSYGIGAVLIPNTSLTPFGGFVDSSEAPLYKTPTDLAAAVNANYQAQGVAARVNSDQMQQYFHANPSSPLSNTPSPGYIPPAAQVNPPPSSGQSTNSLQISPYDQGPFQAQLVSDYFKTHTYVPFPTTPSSTLNLNSLQNAIANMMATGSGTSTTTGVSTPVGTSGLTIILAVVGIGVALMMGGGKGDKYAD